MVFVDFYLCGSVVVFVQQFKQAAEIVAEAKVKVAELSERVDYLRGNMTTRDVSIWTSIQFQYPCCVVDMVTQSRVLYLQCVGYVRDPDVYLRTVNPRTRVLSRIAQTS